MQINNQQLSSSNQLQTTTTDKLLELKQGELYRAQIKERISDSEAIIQIRGKEVLARFEGGVPSGEKVTVQVTGQTTGLTTRTKDTAITVKTIPEPNQNNQTESKALQELGVSQKDSSELKQAVKMLLDKGVTLTKESVQELRAFFEKSPGTSEQKLETIKALANKNLEVIPAHLRAVHEALHGRPVNEVIRDIINELNADFKDLPKEIRELINRVKNRDDIENIKRLLKANVPLDKIRNYITTILEKAQAVNFKINIDVDADQVSDAKPSLIELLKNLTKELQKETNLTKGLLQLQDELNKNEALTSVKKLEDSIQKALELYNRGRELGARQEIGAALAALVKEVNEHQAEYKTNTQQSMQQDTHQINHHNSQHPGQQSTTQSAQSNAQQSTMQSELPNTHQSAQQTTQTNIQQNTQNIEQQNTQQNGQQPNTIQNTYEINDQMQAGFQLDSKDLIVTRVTQKLAELTHEFRELKRDITRNLDNIQRLIEQSKTSSQQARQLLESTIKKLDNAILKSDIMLFTDMKTEKDLLKASGQLAEAKKLLAKGEQGKALEIVQNVKSALDKINFKPSDTKVMHFVSKEFLSASTNSATTLTSQMTELFSRTQLTEPSARQIYEMLRSYGLNHENELANKLIFKQGEGAQNHQQSQQQQQDINQQNMKALLMKLLRGELEGQNGKTMQMAEQALSNITGQQLLSKSEANTNLQTLYYNLPFILEDQVEKLQVYVNSRNKEQQMDWENCSLYFLIETKKLGEVGILINSTDRNLSVTLKNDKVDFKQKMEPLVEATKERLKEIGYNVGNILFTKMTEVKKENNNRMNINNTKEPIASQPIFTEKGLDFKI